MTIDNVVCQKVIINNFSFYAFGKISNYSLVELATMLGVSTKSEVVIDMTIYIKLEITTFHIESFLSLIDKKSMNEGRLQLNSCNWWIKSYYARIPSFGIYQPKS